jgi:hypothetical protein
MSNFKYGDLVMVLGVMGVDREDGQGYYLGMGNQASPKLKMKVKVDVGGCLLHVEPEQVVEHKAYWDAKREAKNGSDS